ncbi:MAG TPA: ribosome assembly RNA-binding protein YhbY, partial [Candidatus Latescibacteria bacterium]|nr:ribosome assembly RNA-binding protein YhbY [Candidatus Latescibacterota bacterium]
QLAELSESDIVGMIGHLAILYRQHPDEARRKVQI